MEDTKWIDVQVFDVSSCSALKPRQKPKSGPREKNPLSLTVKLLSHPNSAHCGASSRALLHSGVLSFVPTSLEEGA
jgi:hypothetical protein